MTDTALDDPLTIIAHVASDAPRACAGPPWPMGAASLGRSFRPASGVCQATRLTPALFVLPLWLVVCLVLGTDDSRAAAPPASRAAEVWEVEAAFREAFQLWADERFDAL
jgi:hypothetical protein